MVLLFQLNIRPTLPTTNVIEYGRSRYRNQFV